MQSSSLTTTSAPTPKREIVRIVFPKTPELAMYALATTQNFVEYYGKALERVRMWTEHEDAQRSLEVEVHCDQRFYLTFQKSFPTCVRWVPPGMTSLTDEPDEMCIVLHESTVSQYTLLPTYSMQWLMGQLAGTVPKMVPYIAASAETSDLLRPVVHAQLGIELPNAIYVNSAVEHYEEMFRLARQASIIVAPQGLLTVLGVALGKPVVEVTKTASMRSFLSVSHYIQVSQLNLDAYFKKSLMRGIEWLTKTTAASTAQSADAPSPQLVLFAV